MACKKHDIFSIFSYSIIQLACVSACVSLTMCLCIKMLTWVLLMKVKDEKKTCPSVCLCVCLCVCLSVSLSLSLSLSLFANSGLTSILIHWEKPRASELRSVRFPKKQARLMNDHPFEFQNIHISVKFNDHLPAWNYF